MSTTKPNRTLLLLFSVVVLDLIGFGIVMPILPFYADQFLTHDLVFWGRSFAKSEILGLLLASYSAMQFLFSSIWGKLSDRFGRKPIMLFTMIGAALSLTLLGLANSLTLLFVGRILSGIFAANISVASAFVSDITTEENRSKGMGMIGAAFGIGFLLGPAIAGPLSQGQNYHLPILVAAGLNLLNFIYALFQLPEPPRHHKIESKIDTKTLGNPVIFKMCLLYFLLSIAVSQLESMFAFFMKDQFGYDSHQVAYIFVMMALIMIAIQGGLIRPLTQKYGEKILFITGSLILAATFCFVPGSPTVPLLLIPLALASVGRGLSQPSLMSLVSKKSQDHLRGSVMGVFQASASLARVFGPFIAGYLYGKDHSYPFYFASGLMAVVFFISTLL